MTASLLSSSPHAKAPPPTAGKIKDTAESTKLTPAHPSTTSLAGLLCTQHSILRALPWLTPCLHPFFPSKSGSGTCLQPLLLRGWWHIVTGVLILWCEWVPGAVGTSYPRLQHGFRAMCALGEPQGKPEHSMEEEKAHFAHPLPPPPPSPKATSKTDHRDGTEEHALKRGRGEDVSSCGEAEPASLPRQASHHHFNPSQLVWVQSLLPSQPTQGPCPH